MVSMTKQQLRPREIAEQGLIKNGTGGDNVGSNYKYILKLIKVGRLKAKNYGTKSRAFWVVSLAEIERFNNEIDN